MLVFSNTGDIMKKKRRLKTWIIQLFIVLCLTGFIYSFFKIIKWKIDVNNNKNVKKQIDEKVNIIVNEEKEIQYDIDFTVLKEQNADTVAYISVPNTNINYIVVKGNDNSFYLNHNFNKKYNSAGWIFADYHNNFDNFDKNIIIYGHNTKDGSMFGTLRKVITKEWYTNNDNLNIVLVTENGTYNYEVFSTYTITSEDYYINTLFDNDIEFASFAKKLKSRSVYNFSKEVNGEDKILTLSSCIGDGKKRVVLHAVLK